VSLRGHKTVATSVCPSVRLLVVDFGNTHMAVPADAVRGILQPEQVSDNDVLCFLGVNYPLIDLARPLSLPRKTSGADVRVILCSEGDCHCAFQVDQVLGLVEVGRLSLLPLPPQFRGEERRWFDGLFLFRETAALVLNCGWILQGGRRTSTGNRPDAMWTSSRAAPSVHGADPPIQCVVG
jgi:chemotaxis signal transduction protein